MDEQAERSQLQLTYVLIAALIAVVVAVPLVIIGLVIGAGWWIGLLVGILTGAAVVWHWVRTADQRVLRTFEANSVDLASIDAAAFARIKNLLDGLSLSIGTTEPELLVVADESRNALAVARGERQTLIITSSLAIDLERIELEGVVAELLVRLKTGDAENATSLASVVGRPFLDSALSGLTRPFAVQLLRRNLDEHRDIVADQRAAAVTRYPPGLSAGLGRIADGPLTPVSATTGTDHLWMVPPPRLELVVPHAPVDWRVEALLEI